MLTRPGVNYAKDWLDHSFLFPGLVWSEKSLDVITRRQSTTIFLCIGPFSAWWRTNKQTNNQVILEQACFFCFVLTCDKAVFRNMCKLGFGDLFGHHLAFGWIDSFRSRPTGWKSYYWREKSLLLSCTHSLWSINYNFQKALPCVEGWNKSHFGTCWIWNKNMWM